MNYDDKKRVKKTSLQFAAKKAASSDDEMLENRFAVFCDVGAEQGEDEDLKVIEAETDTT